MAKKTLPDATCIRQCLDYDPADGRLIWKRRPDVSKSWNTKYAGTIAGSRLNSGVGYIQVYLDGRNYLAHRLIWVVVTGKWPRKCVDHHNHVGTDNRWQNLREADQVQNQKNRLLNKNSPTGFKGVRKGEAKGKWAARIMIKRKGYHLGTFSSAEEAHAAYCRAAQKTAKEFFHPG